MTQILNSSKFNGKDSIYFSEQNYIKTKSVYCGTNCPIVSCASIDFTARKHPFSALVQLSQVFLVCTAHSPEQCRISQWFLFRHHLQRLPGGFFRMMMLGLLVLVLMLMLVSFFVFPHFRHRFTVLLRWGLRVVLVMANIGQRCNVGNWCRLKVRFLGPTTGGR